MRPPVSEIAEEVCAAGFAHVPAARMAELLAADALAAFPAFRASWNDLGPDRYMADGGRYRRRRHAVFRLTSQGLVRLPHQPHYQSRDYNPLNGGVQRWFEPVTPEVADSPFTRTLIDLCRDVFAPLEPAPVDWRVEMHQFRIEAADGAEGRPTPEGLHRDGVDWVLVLLVGRTNVESGVTTVRAGGGAAPQSFTLAEPLDAVFLDDHRVLHGVTPIRPLDPARPAARDALVLTFRSDA